MLYARASAPFLTNPNRPTAARIVEPTLAVILLLARLHTDLGSHLGTLCIDRDIAGFARDDDHALVDVRYGQCAVDAASTSTIIYRGLLRFTLARKVGHCSNDALGIV